MSPPAAGFSLRDRLVAVGVVSLLYVVVMVLQLASVLRPAADELRGRTRNVLADHDRIAESVRALRTARRDIARSVPPVNANDRSLRSIATLRSAVRARIDSGVALRASIERSGVPVEMRILLADALDEETAFAVQLIEAIRAVEIGRPASAVVPLRLSGLRSDSAEALLSAAQRIALRGVLQSEDRLQGYLDDLEWWALAWLAVGLALFALAAWIIRVQLLRPVRTLESAVRRIAAGDLATTVHVEREDELGRLAGHVNTMALRLRQRAEAETARRESLTERFGRLLDESSNEIGVYDAGTLQALQLNLGARVNLGLGPEQVAEITLPSLLRAIEPSVLAGELERLRTGEQKRLLLRTRQTRRDGSSYPVEITIQHSVDRDAAVFITVAEDAGIRERVRELDVALRDFAVDDRRLPGDTALLPSLRAITAMAAGALRARRVSVWRENSGVRTCVGASDGDDALDLASRAFAPAAASVSIPVPAGARGSALLLAESHDPARQWTAEEETFLRAVAALVARALDAEERQLLEQALARAQRLDSIGQLAGGIAHDFNNILTAILGNLEVARETLGPGASVSEELAEAEQAARRAADLTRQLLTFARHQRVDLRIEDLNVLTRDAERLLSRLVGADLRIETALHPAPLPVRAGAGQVEQVLMNLAVNARDAMPAGGVIRVSTRPELIGAAQAGTLGVSPGAYAELRIVDTGVGMSPEVTERVFDPFFTTKATGAGTGLGLAVCYGIVRQAGGAIAVESASGLGSTFRVLLPLFDASPSVVTEPVTSSSDRGSETVLLAEDERIIRDLVERALVRRGYRVLTAGDGQEALQVARLHEGRIDLLVSDVVMPRIGGPELARALRKRDPAVRVLLMSGYSADALREGHGVPDSEFVPKPFTPDELARRVRQLLDRPPPTSPASDT